MAEAPTTPEEIQALLDSLPPAEKEKFEAACSKAAEGAVGSFARNLDAQIADGSSVSIPEGTCKDAIKGGLIR